MQLSDKTLKILKNFTSVNESIRIKPGSVIETCSKTQSIYARANVEESFPVEVVIFNLAQFISIVSLFNEPDLKFESKFVWITSGKKKVKYIYAMPSMIVHPPDQSITLANASASFKVGEHILQNLSKARGILKLPEIRFIGNDEGVSLEAINSSDPTDNSFVESIESDDIITPGAFNMILKADNVVIIPSAYDVSVTEHYLHFKGEEVEYFIAAEA